MKPWGAVLGALPGSAAVCWASLVNPWFLDEPLLVGLCLAVLPGVFGAVVFRRLAWRRGGVALAVLALAWVGLVLRPTPGPSTDPGLLVMGIDGASWELIDGLELPALEALQDRGHRAVLTSDEPMFSPLLWTTMATGKPPAEHGIKGFRTRADQARAARIWEIAGAAGKSVGLYKWLVTWPPVVPGGDGFVVPAWLAPTPETAPAELSFVKELELSRRLKRKRLGEVRPGWRLALAGIPEGLRASTLRHALTWSLRERVARPGPEERAWRLQLLRVWIDRDVFVAQLHRHRPELATFTTYATDALGHTHWGAREACVTGGACPPWAGAIDEAYGQADGVLAEVIASVGPETTVLVLSDHGFRAMGSEDAGRYFAPRTSRLQARLSAEVGAVDVARVGHKLAVTMLADDPDAQRLAVARELGTWTQASTGEPFYRWEAIGGSDIALGLTLRDERIDAHRLASDTVGGEPLADYAELTEAYSGEHHAAGIWLAAGPGIAPGSRGGPYALVDVAPTALALLGLPAAVDMAGSVRHGAELQRVETYAHLVTGGDVEVDDVNTEMLELLGYVDRPETAGEDASGPE